MHVNDIIHPCNYESVPEQFISWLVYFLFYFFSQRDTYDHVRYMLSAVRLSSVCDVGAPYSAG